MCETATKTRTAENKSKTTNIRNINNSKYTHILVKISIITSIIFILKVLKKIITIFIILIT